MVVRTYDDLADVIAQLNAGPKPLALYYFGKDDDEQRTVVESTTSGGVTINDVMMHPGMLDAPFGGIGASGTGHYNGREGFLEFSHARTVFVAPDQDPRREWGDAAAVRRRLPRRDGRPGHPLTVHRTRPPSHPSEGTR